MVEIFANSGDPDQMPHSAVSGLSLHCLPVIHLGVSSLQQIVVVICNTYIVIQSKMSYLKCPKISYA